MELVTSSSPTKTNSFKLNKICFDQSDIVSVDAACIIHQQLVNTTLLFSFASFNDLLRLGGSSSEKLQLAICDKLTSQEPTPYTIDITHQPLVFTSMCLCLSMLLPNETICYSVDTIMPMSLIQQAKHLKENIKHFDSCALQQNKDLNLAISNIASQYLYYKGLLELDINETTARIEAGLENDTLFKIAYYACRK